MQLAGSHAWEMVSEMVSEMQAWLRTNWRRRVRCRLPASGPPMGAVGNKALDGFSRARGLKGGSCQQPLLPLRQRLTLSFLVRSVCALPSFWPPPWQVIGAVLHFFMGFIYLIIFNVDVSHARHRAQQPPPGSRVGGPVAGCRGVLRRAVGGSDVLGCLSSSTLRFGKLAALVPIEATITSPHNSLNPSSLPPSPTPTPYPTPHTWSCTPPCLPRCRCSRRGPPLPPWCLASPLCLATPSARPVSGPTNAHGP